VITLESTFLDTLDQILKPGAALFSPEFRELHARFITGRQTRSGGFRGRGRMADLYYTEFAVRAMVLLDTPCDLKAVGKYIKGIKVLPSGVVHAFSLLNLLRMLQLRGVSIRPEKMDGLLRCANEMMLDIDNSMNHIFLRAICRDLCSWPNLPWLSGLRKVLDLPTGCNPIEGAWIHYLQSGDGGFRQRPKLRVSEVNATAAAVSYLALAGELGNIKHQAAVDFLLSMQTADGGLKNHRTAPAADLLSTFTGLITLAALGALERANLAAVARFVREMAAPDGGFRGWIGDTEADVEYTYYGLATAALLRTHATSRLQEKKP